MKLQRLPLLFLLLASVLLFNGCIAVPPLVNVTHKGPDQDINNRLDSLDQRLNRIEQKLDSQQR